MAPENQFPQPQDASYSSFQPAMGEASNRANYQSPFAPVQPPPKRKLRPWQIIVISVSGTIIACCVLSIIIAAIGSNQSSPKSAVDNSNGNQSVGSNQSRTQDQPGSLSSSPTEQPTRRASTPLPTPTRIPPTAVPSWKTTKVFQGYQTEKTSVFLPQNQWRIAWSCNPGSSYFGEYNVIADVYEVYPDGEKDFYDLGVNEICTNDNTQGISDHYFDPGTYILDITTDGAFVFDIQEYETGTNN
jgi:hypothetical protein